MAYKDRERGFINEIQDFLAGGTLGESQDLMGQIPDLYEGIDAPTYSDLYGQDLQAQQLGPSDLGGLQVDPTGLAAAQQALSGLQDIYGQGGLNAVDRARLAQVESEQAANQRAIQQSMREGQGQGFAQAQGLLGSQAGANRAYGQGTNIAGMALQRSQDALQQAGSLGMGMQGQLFGQEAEKARARDAIERFNAGNRQEVASENLRRQNAARLNAFQTASQHAGDMAGVYQGMAGQKEKLGRSQLQGFADIGDAGLKAIGMATPAGIPGLVGGALKPRAKSMTDGWGGTDRDSYSKW